VRGRTEQQRAGRGRTCGLCQRAEKCVQEGDYVEDLGMDGRTILELKFHVYVGRAWIGFSWVNEDKWRNVVGTVMNFQFS